MLYQQKLGSFFIWLKNHCPFNADVLEKLSLSLGLSFNNSFSTGLRSDILH